jgi:hypothetical protein
MSDSNNTIPSGFRVISGFPRYAIDANGTVISICGHRGGTNRPWADAIRVKPATKKGYYFVCLCHDGYVRQATLHTLVLTMFVGPCPDGMQCRHLDGNTANNHVDNLAWGTRTENERDKILHGTFSQGERHGRSKLTENDILEIRARAASGETLVDIAKDFPMHKGGVSRIVRRKIWKHV